MAHLKMGLADVRYFRLYLIQNPFACDQIVGYQKYTLTVRRLQSLLHFINLVHTISSK